MADILIIGAGPAGLTAGIYAARAGYSALVLEKSIYGGQVSLTGDVDNYPTRPSIQGPQFAEDLHEHAKALGVELLFEEVKSLSLAGPVKTVTTGQAVHKARAVIVAAGAARRRLGVPGEEEFIGRGVSYCATCDAAFFRGKEVAIVGGGNTAFGDALFLSNHCKKVTLIHRRAAFRAQKVKQDALKARKNVEVIAPAAVRAIEGDAAVERLVLDVGGKACTIQVSGVFVSIGLVPETAFLEGQLPLAPSGYVPVGESCVTALPGVYVAGDLREKPLRQIVTAAADGAVAAVAAAEYLTELDEGSPSS